LTVRKINYEEFRKKVASSTIEGDIENCFIIKPIQNEELITRVRAKLE
jgi:hypothetical protein